MVLTEVDPKPNLNFWLLIHGGFLDLAVLEWCKMFGSNAEYTHWKTLVEESDRDSFKSGLFLYTNVEPDEWDENWRHLKNYRDKLVAHHNRENNVAIYPKLDIALSSSCYYHNYLSGLLQEEDSDLLPVLDDYRKEFHEQAIKIASDAIEATKKHSEAVF